MATIDTVIKKWQRLNVTTVLRKSLQSTKDKIEEFQIGQMALGQNPQGKKIGRYRSKKYAQEKYQLSTLAGLGYVDLRLHGDFYRGVFAQIKNSSIIIFSRDEKAPEIDAKYHPFGLSPQSRSTYVTKFLKPEFIKNFKRELSGL